jgi:hypothetical protein
MTRWLSGLVGVLHADQNFSRKAFFEGNKRFS